MRKKFFILIVVAGLLNIQFVRAQQNAYETIVDGVKVIVQPGGNDIVEIQTIIKGGVSNYPAGKCGIEALAMTALGECGTLNHDKNSFKNQLDKVNAAVYGFSGKDYSVVKMNCVKSDFDVVWPLYAEAITSPKFDTKEFARIKQDALNNLKEAESDPDAAIDKLADKVAFAGSNYANYPDGSAGIIEKLTADETKAFYQSILTKSRMLIVVVADLDKNTIEQKVHELLRGIKQGAPFEIKRSIFKSNKNTFSAEQRDLATNYIEGVTGGPAPGTPDFTAFNVAMHIFNNRHFLEVRTNNGLSYAPQAWFNNGSTAVAKFSVSTTQPDKYIAVFYKLVDKVKTDGFKPEEVADMKVIYLTGFYYKMETNEKQAASLASNEVLSNNWRRSLTLVDDVKKLTVEEINNAFRKYIGNIVWVYQGDTKKVNPLNYTNYSSQKSASAVSQ
ncbi:MAG: M16 family metallopeptidase [Mucilaginibacter sp.]